MKYPLLIIAVVLLNGCGNRKDHNQYDVKEGQTYEPSFVSPYKNLTKTRNVVFGYNQDWKNKTYFVSWDIWVDGDIMASGSDFNVRPQDIEAYKSTVFRHADSIMPELLRLKAEFTK